MRHIFHNPHSQRGEFRVCMAVVVAVLLFAAMANPSITSAQQPCSNGIAVPDPDSSTGLVRDCATLLSSRDTLRGDASLNWSADLSIHEWDGVTVDEQSQRVTVLRLREQGLNGTIPSELGNLTHLQDLSLPDNQLRGTIPAELGNFTELKVMWLSGNQLTGAIPPALGNLSKLETLALHNNQLTGAIPPELGNIPELRWLQLYRNQLTGTIPSELGNLSELRELVLHRSQLEGSIPPELGNLSNLNALFLNDNQLEGSIPTEFGKLTSLGRLWLKQNQLTGELPQSLTALASLEEFHFHNNDGLCAPTDEGFQAWLLAIPDHSGLDCLTDLPPAEVIQDPDISYLTWYIGEGVKQEELQRAMAGARQMHEYAASLGYPETDEEIIVYFYHDLEQIAVAYAREAGWSLDESRKFWEGKEVWAVSGRGWIVFKVSAPSEPIHSRIYGTAIHEFIHSAYQHRLAGLLTDSSEVYPRGYTDPRWLGEGMATLLTAVLESESGDSSYADERERRVERTYEVDLPLSEAEEWPDSTDPNYDRTRGCIYDCGMIAVELLASHVGLSALTDFYTMLHPGDTWQQTFETASEMSVDDFYDLFEEHRAAGFPAVETPIGRPIDCTKPLTETGTYFTGSWTADDCTSENRPDDGDHYARFYTFTLDTEAEITITVTSEHDTYLYLLEGVSTSDAVLHENDDQADEVDCSADLANTTDSCIAASLDAGNYMIEVTTFDPGITGEFTLAITGLDGATVEPPSPPPLSTGSYKSLVIGELHTCGLRTDGTVVCWGNDIMGQVSDTPTNDRFTYIAAGPHHTCGIRTDGTVACWGNDDDGLVSGTPRNGTYTAIFVGRYHNCGIRTDNSAVCWGRNEYGQASPP